LTLVPASWLRFLGIVPIAFGVRALIQALRGHANDEGSMTTGAGLGTVVALTLGNGSDNIAAYTPMFRLGSAATNVTTIAVFVVLVGVWCMAGSWLASRRHVVRAIERFGHWLVPVTFIGIGVWVLV
jgi:cadmium resistance protein CadD (predicted permease)